jgi:predicted amidophosphoribosyltransferase
MAEVSQNEKYCPVCKKINKSTAKFCAGCGYDFSEERICKECGNKIRPGKKFCSACGAKVED